MMENDDLKTYCDKCNEMTYNNDVKEIENGVFWCSNCRYDFNMEMMINIEE